ncbi:hypothetical protein EDEG_02770 [Edhazardia aedis USNM 41457]|uniref:Uncharacterized protein n=1 Tax=Edhazardia aedis (strain USNM 41457) TaxID=1003232 RepID=J9D5K9_EDHAE|nr:hypothetical protein EDEG_02770 [Edhazardia aedis USNM 41457]|eukprot:EJW02829.1 hypothetical protein EDEG_02770 [Edhazardia aedis USNM 41457]
MNICILSLILSFYLCMSFKHNIIFKIVLFLVHFFLVMIALKNILLNKNSSTNFFCYRIEFRYKRRRNNVNKRANGNLNTNYKFHPNSLLQNFFSPGFIPIFCNNFHSFIDSYTIFYIYKYIFSI